MTNPVATSMELLTGLLEERRRYETWLAQLEARRAATPAHVFEKVHGDYSHRLRGVSEQLRARAADLESSVGSLQERVNVLQAEENARRDERAEVELRAAVGEFPPEQARERLAQCDEEIGRISTERSQLAGELGRLQEVLTLARRPVGEPEPRAAAPLAEAAEAAPPAQPAGNAPVASDGSSGGFGDELAFLQSVVHPRDQQRSAPIDTFAPPAARTRDHGSAPQVAPEAPSARTASATPPGSTPAFLKNVPAEQAKTLKCQECGTMNYATEWYCERCGGELAAM